MPQAMPATKGGEIHIALGHMVVAAMRHLDESTFVMRAFRRDLTALERVDALAAGVAWSAYMMAIGNRDEALRHARNVRALGNIAAGAESQFIANSNLGHFTDAAMDYPVVVDIRHGRVLENLAKGLICASFHAVIETADACKAANIELHDQHTRAAEIAMSAATVLERLGVSEVEVQAMLDVAGEVIREQHLFWLGAGPAIRVQNDADGAVMLFELVLGVSPERADELTDVVLTRIIDRELDRPGIAISFLSDPAALAEFENADPAR